MADIEYSEGKQLQAGWVTTDQVPLGADTYFPGMLLEFDGTNYIALVTDANLAAIYNGDERILSLAGTGDVIAAGEINPEGLVDATGVKLPLTEVKRAAYRANGFYIKRV